MAIEFEKALAEYDVEIADKLDDNRCIGSGCYGTVYQITVNGIPRIAKRLLGVLQSRDVIPSEREGIKNRFVRECYLLSQLDHPNVVQFVGVQLHPELLLIMESMRTDLDNFLSTDAYEIPLSIKLSILQDVSSGLLYLHTREEPIVHRDLTPSNILLTTDVRAKIADLGVSKLLENYPQIELVHTKCPGALAYMPPEALCEHPKCDTSFDVFSFGQMTLYVATQSFPHVYDPTADVDCRAALHEALRNGEVELLRRNKSIETLQEDHCLLDIIQQCLQDERKRRPTSKSLNTAMKTLCVIHPKSLEDIISVWGSKAESEDHVDQHDVREDNKVAHQREMEGKESTINDLEEQLAVKRVAIVELEQDVARLKEEKNQLSNLLQGQAKTVDALKEDVTLFQMQATELIDGIGDKSTEAENLKSEKERIKAEKDKLNKRCSELMNELEARKIEALTYKADFEDERRDREAAAGKKEEEIFTLHRQYKEKITKLEAMLQNREKQTAEESSKQIEQDRSQSMRIANLEKAYKSVNEKLQRVENMKQLKQQKEEEEQKLYSDYLIQLLQENNIYVPSSAEVLKHDSFRYQSPATFDPQYFQRRTIPPLPRQVYIDQSNPEQERPVHVTRPTHHSSGMDRYYSDQYQQNTPASHFGPQIHHKYEQHTEASPHHGNSMQVRFRQQTPKRHQRIMNQMHLSQSDPCFPHGGYASSPLPPQYIRWYSEEPNYYSDGHHLQHQRHENAPGLPTLHQHRAGDHNVMYGHLEASPHYYRKYPPSAHNLSPSESLPANIESLQIIREQAGSNSSDEGETESTGNVTKEIEQRANEVIEQTSADRDVKTDMHRPLDPNLVCPMCNKKFRIGEIQKFKKHVAKGVCVT